VQSTLGSGTTFTVYQPVADATAAGAGNAQDSNHDTKSNGEDYRNVLVVEDDPSIQTLLQNIFKRHGIRHTLAVDGASALEIWRTAIPPFDLLVTDIVMPKGVDGIRLARTLRQDNPDLGVVLTSGFSSLLFDSANLTMAGNPPMVLQKPYTPDELLSAMTEACISPLA